jgi:hypothetical protein
MVALLNRPAYVPQNVFASHYGTFIAPGSHIVAFVRSTGAQGHDDSFVQSLLVTNLDQALQRCTAGQNDVIVVLEGHSESVTTGTFLASLVAGTRIVGIGRGSNRPVFRWTETAASWAVDVDDCVIENLHLRLEGASGVVKAINITGANTLLQNCLIQVSSGASNKAAIAIEVGTGAHNTEIVGNKIIGTVAGEVVDCIKVVAAVTDCRIVDNEIDVPTSVATVGPIDVTAAALGLNILRNLIRNSQASSTAAITFGAAAMSGICAYNGLCAMGADATPAATIIADNAANIMRFIENYGISEDDLSGVITPAAT